MERVRGSLVLFAALVVVSATLGVGGPIPSAADATADSSVGGPADTTERGRSADGSSASATTRSSAARPDRHQQAAVDNNIREQHLAAGTRSRSTPSVGPEVVKVAGTDGSSCTFFTVEDAIAAAAAGSTVYISPGIYPAATANSDYNVSKDLDLVKGNSNCQPTVGGSSTTVVLSLNAGSTVDAVLEVSNGAAVRLDRITVQGGNSAEGTVKVAAAGSLVTLDDAVVRNGTNPSNSVGGGGVRVDPGARLIATNASQIENNSAVIGGAVYVDDGVVTIDLDSNVELNDASGDGGGIYATGTTSVIVSGRAEVRNNTAGGDGGGVYLDASALTVTAGGTEVAANDAARGGGIFASNASSATVRAAAVVRANTANFGGGLYGLDAGTALNLIAGSVSDNTVSNNGGGIIVTASALADINPQSIVSGNTATGFGGGIAVFTPATLDADGQTAASAVRVVGNSAGGDGGGIWASGTVALDTVRVQGNSATAEGGGLYATGTVNITENFDCALSALGFEQYCNEFRNNTSQTLGGAIYSSGAQLTVLQTGFIANEADGGAVIMAVGASDVDVRASVAISNTETIAGGDGLVTAQGTSTLSLVGVTFADHAESFLDTDDSATATVSRVLTTTGTLGLVATPVGTCNVSAVAANLPDLTVADPQFVTKEKSDYVPDADSEAVDACNQAGGFTVDSRDTAARDGNGVASSTEFDIGGIEAPTPK